MNLEISSQPVEGTDAVITETYSLLVQGEGGEIVFALKPNGVFLWTKNGVLEEITKQKELGLALSKVVEAWAKDKGVHEVMLG